MLEQLGGLARPAVFAVEGLTEALAQELQPLGIRATVIEPGFFRTDFLENGSSLRKVRREIEDYDATVGQMRRFAAGHSKRQPGDPAKLAQALLALVDAPSPPVRLPLGRDAVQRIEDKNARVSTELAAWRAVAESTDHTS